MLICAQKYIWAFANIRSYTQPYSYNLFWVSCVFILQQLKTYLVWTVYHIKLIKYQYKQSWRKCDHNFCCYWCHPFNFLSLKVYCYYAYSVKQEIKVVFLVVNNQTQKAVMLYSINGVGRIDICHMSHRLDERGTRPCFRWFQVQDRIPDTSGEHENTLGSFGITLKRSAWQ